MRALLYAFALILAHASMALAVEYASKDEAKAMTEAAVGFFQTRGQDTAFKAFNTGTDGFKDRDLYVFVYDKDGTCVSHGANTAIIGRNLFNLKDVDGKELIKEIVGISEPHWVGYRWVNPQTRDIEKKSAYILQKGGFWFGVGYYIAGSHSK